MILVTFVGDISMTDLLTSQKNGPLS
ncbi:hypothetical protein XBI1_1150036 [Xenorhabdus bovienii str. Intermedium]|uniref:Uncharacterized protein n=1 Tax=Xenorhabdus bovienii str. Intermedium TaxID=1379677 RepID=A0A077QCT2_XENBV|nr:hypothetical protein XBI1_1150036 [Xenorhabdus bovienii str. Intermedium]